MSLCSFKGGARLNRNPNWLGLENFCLKRNSTICSCIIILDNLDMLDIIEIGRKSSNLDVLIFLGTGVIVCVCF